MQDIVYKTVEALHNHQTILYPTDTIWGIGCNAHFADAVERIYAIKQRDHAKSMLILALPEQLCLPKSLSPESPFFSALQLLTHSDRPTTVIFPNALQLLPQLATNLPAQDGSIGIRIPQHDFCQTILHQLGHPIVSTSANFSGHPSPIQYQDIASDLKAHIDFCVPNLPALDSHCSSSSRIVKLDSKGQVIILRD